ncbi:MAG: thioesterase [Oceanospirillaceae bacterium]|uniref:acyl-CoA thioesterase n=1 Tax=unclassified Thalassolituus TaxID=2624967 RepID=UPI000C09B256|nr:MULTISPECIES: thioesterase family protein [unclassified Thalassolituus]MAK89683.1 thioesterase [Thalassolituus sp.]MAS24469.1 thioesterase [Oceanospirillaceae bacterium]MAX98218.1 thioesterase [Oceanospirillaceae bacterium]MBL34533.1 thioesterase [Oceanospirillaceae bacterium]MBS54204.1 thioesterase [Oceanospirillaceae bacterium]|tara:strand:+ start:447 stop:842 length:396 start_codon:yes stop_codon:yes gene_type:complete
MWTLTISPRFGDTDALGHINNTVLPVWFEEGRTPVFRMFTPDLNPQDWHLIIAKIEVEYLGELFYGRDIELRTYIQKLGNSSMTIAHEAWQDGKLGAKGCAIMVHFDHDAKKSVAIPDSIREQLIPHLQTL